MRSLFSISADLLALEEMLSETGGEITDDEAGVALDKFFDELGEERDAKIDNYAALIRQFEAKAEARQAEAYRLQQLAATDANNAKRLKARLQAFFELHGIKKLETARFKLSVQANGGKAPLIVPEQWEREPASAPERYHKVTVSLDRDMIRGDLEAVFDSDDARAEAEKLMDAGCSIAPRGSHLRVK
jgi:hypothetical protein